MQIIDLFSGIGGFSLAGRWMGWRTIQFCEIDKFCQRVLSYHFPGVPIHDNIKTLSFQQITSNKLYDANEPTILVGGFPCQPYSVAGKRKGDADDRHLWPYMLKTIKEGRPDWVVAENVRGLVTWSGGMVFNEVQVALEDEGYEVQSFILPACSVNAPHRRDRVWIVAYYTGMGREQRTFIRGKVSEEIGGTKFNIRDKSQAITHPNSNREMVQRGNRNSNNKEWDCKEEIQERKNEQFRIIKSDREVTSNSQRGSKQGGLYEGQGEGQSGGCSSKFITNTSNQGLQGSKNNGDIRKCWEDGNKQSSRCFCTNWQEFPTQSPLCSRDDGVSSQLSGITFSKHRNESIKAYGNAIVPQVVFQIFKAIEEYNTLSRGN